MNLIRTHPQNLSSICAVQLEHRKTAVDYAIAGIGLLHDRNIRAFKGDAFFAQLEGVMKEWVIETLIQGAYIREYHIWEKDTKAYVLEQARLNGTTLPPPKHTSTFFWLRETLTLLGATISSNVINALDQMRLRVNTAKHDPGVLVEHFVTKADYNDGMGAISRFWNEIDALESY